MLLMLIQARRLTAAVYLTPCRETYLYGESYHRRTHGFNASYVAIRGLFQASKLLRRSRAIMC